MVLDSMVDVILDDEQLGKRIVEKSGNPTYAFNVLPRVILPSLNLPRQSIQAN
jgi:hypothetical protein